MFVILILQLSFGTLLEHFHCARHMHTDKNLITPIRVFICETGVGMSLVITLKFLYVQPSARYKSIPAYVNIDWL